MELTQIFTLAAKEFRDRMRNRWVLAVALVRMPHVRQPLFA